MHGLQDPLVGPDGLVQDGGTQTGALGGVSGRCCARSRYLCCRCQLQQPLLVPKGTSLGLNSLYPAIKLDFLSFAATVSFRCLLRGSSIPPLPFPSLSSPLIPVPNRHLHPPSLLLEVGDTSPIPAVAVAGR